MAAILRFPTDRIQARTVPARPRALTSNERVQRLVERLERIYADPQGESERRLAASLGHKLERRVRG